MEENCCEYQEKLLSSRDAKIIFKHFKSLKEQNRLPSEIQHSNIIAKSGSERVELLNNYFHSVFVPKIEFSVADIDTNFTEIDNLDVSTTSIEKILSDLDVIKSGGPDGLPPVPYRKLAKSLSKSISKFFCTIKRV